MNLPAISLASTKSFSVTLSTSVTSPRPRSSKDMMRGYEELAAELDDNEHSDVKLTDFLSSASPTAPVPAEPAEMGFFSTASDMSAGKEE